MRRPAQRTMAPIDLDPRPRRFPAVGAVHGNADLLPPLVGAVERLIDFVTEPGQG